MTDADARLIRAEVEHFCKHPRMKHKSFGPGSAEELLYKLAWYLENKTVKWPVPATEGEQA